MNWPGLNLVDQLDRLSSNAAAATPVWHPVIAPGLQSAAPSNARTDCILRDGWTFIPIGMDSGQPGQPRAASIPERWPDERDHVAGWYTRRVPLSLRDGERLIARFEQVALFCVLYVNGIECGRHLGAYTPFDFDVTPAARNGDNLLAIYVHDASAALGAKGVAFNQVSSWRPQSPTPLPGGPVGALRLERRPAAHVADVFVKTSTRRHELTLECELANAGPQSQAAKVDFALLNWPDGTPVPLPIPAQAAALSPGKIAKITVAVPWADPRLWSPDHPNLYTLRATLTAGGATDVLDTRFGFREFWAEGRQFMLNGIPTRLFGESHYGAGRRDERAVDPAQGRDFNRETFLAFKTRYRGNATRVHGQIMSGNVALGADEAGWLLIEQSSIWSVMASLYRNGGEPFLANTRREFAEWIRRDRNCPSVVIWDVENEQIRINKIHQPWAIRLDDFARENDDTRLIEHSGAGWYAPDQQIVHIHMQEHYTDILERWKQGSDRPLVAGEFWVGGNGGQARLNSSLEFLSHSDWVAEEARLYEEALLEMRHYGISGLMPFQISRVVPSLDRQSESKGDAGARAVQHGLQPLTAFFWPRGVSAAAGEELKRELVVCNDSETNCALRVEWSLEGAAAQTVGLNLSPGEQRRIPVSFVIPAKNVRLEAKLLRDGKVEATEEVSLRVADAKRLAPPALQRHLLVYEGAHPGAVDQFKQLGLPATAAAGVPARAGETLWVIAPGASDPALNAQSRKIREYLEAGGRVLCLAQEQWPRWSPVRLGFLSALRATPSDYLDFGVPKASKEILYACYAPIYAASHPIFAGITASDLRFWSPRDGRVSDDALVRPAAAASSASGAWRVLAGGYRRDLISLAEARVGQGTLVFCQAQVLEQSHTPEARLVLMNLLRYLDGAAWAPGSGHVALAGALTAAKASLLTGARPESFAEATPEHGDLLLATDGASTAELERWADAGGTVLVLSAEVARRLPGYAVENDSSRVYIGVHDRDQDHPLFWGVSSTNFLGFDHPCVEGVLSQMPPSARVLLPGLYAHAPVTRGGTGQRDRQELGAFNAAEGPVAVVQPHGRGAWIVTTLAPWREPSPHNRELMQTLLANAGIALPVAEKQLLSAQVLRTAPLKLDGALDDWTSDMADRNVSPYTHAQPIILSAEDAISGQLRGDADLSAIAYFLWHDQALCLGGVVFGAGGKTTISARINGHVLTFLPESLALMVQLDGKPAGKLRAASGSANADDLTDARALAFTEIDPKSWSLQRSGKSPGVTFEIEIPWSVLGYSQPPTQFRGLIRLERPDGAALQSPAAAIPDDPNSWLTLTLAP